MKEAATLWSIGICSLLAIWALGYMLYALLPYKRRRLDWHTLPVWEQVLLRFIALYPIIPAVLICTLYTDADADAPNWLYHSFVAIHVLLCVFATATAMYISRTFKIYTVATVVAILVGMLFASCGFMTYIDFNI